MPLPDSFRKLGASSLQAWEDVQKHDDVLDQRDWQFLRSAYLAIKGDPALEPVARDALFKKMLDRMAASQRLRELCGEIWQPFSGKSAVIAINDRQQPRDAYPFQELIRHLSASGFETTFHSVSLSDPNWTKVRLNEQFAVSFIGRHTMYRDCAVLAEIPADLRFHLPKDNAAMRGQPLAPEFHCITQRRTAAKPLVFEAVQEEGKGERVDWAVVQRFSVDLGVKQVVVLFIEGATSLGTTGAGQWVASGRCDSIKLPSGLALTDSSRLEILLKVHSQVSEPPRPWEPTCYPAKIFIDDAKFVVQQDTLHLAVPRVIAVGTKPKGSANVCYVSFDGDDVRVRSSRPNAAAAQSALFALCLKALRVGKGQDGRWAVEIAALVKDQSLWPRGADFLKGVRHTQWFADNLKEGLLGDALTISHKSERLELNCEIVEEEAL
jgi:hypothetical protein